MTENARRMGACRLCNGSSLRELIDFGGVALGNNLQTTAEAARHAERYPLNLMQCDACGHFQLGFAVAPDILYATNYTYLSGIGSSFVKHFAGYAEWVAENLDLPAKPVMVDVGSNDGTCLKPFQARGYTVCGVDAAQVPARIANENGIETINAFFDADVVAEIKRRHGPVDFVTSHNVLAHVDDLEAVFRNIRNLLKDGGYFCFEVGYFHEVLRTGCLDTIYHEHLDYHHAAPLVRHLTAIGFDVINLSVNSVQGGSIRLLLRKTVDGKVSPQAQEFLVRERDSILYDDEYLRGWRKKIEASMAAFGALVRRHADQGSRIVGYGAPTKATLLMKMAGVGGDGEVNYVVEDNWLKVGRFFPSTGVPIVSSDQLKASPPDVILVFAWNFADDIIEKLRGTFDKPVEVIVPLPDLRMVAL